MGAIFGKPRAKSIAAQAAIKVTEQDRAVLQLKQQRDKLKQYQKRLNQQLEKEREFARELLRNDKKQKALLLLRKKKFMETQLEKAENELGNIEQMVHSIEFAELQSQVVQRLKVGNEALKSLHQLMDIEQIEDILEETREGIEKQREIDQLLGNSLTAEDESALLDELNEMELAQKLPKAASHELPEVSATQETEEEKEKVMEDEEEEEQPVRQKALAI